MSTNRPRPGETIDEYLYRRGKERRARDKAKRKGLNPTATALEVRPPDPPPPVPVRPVSAAVAKFEAGMELARLRKARAKARAKAKPKPPPVPKGFARLTPEEKERRKLAKRAAWRQSRTPEPPTLDPTSPTLTPEEREAVSTEARKVLATRYFRFFCRHLWDVAMPSAPEVVWAPHMDVICDEIQAILDESDRRRKLASEILARWGDDAAAHIEAELGCLP